MQRHLAPGMYARLLVADIFSPHLQESVWLQVLDYDEHDIYLGRITTPLHDVDQLRVGEHVVFRLEHVAEASGLVMAA